jgi:hypothetical protein
VAVFNLLTYFGKGTNYNPRTADESGQAEKVFDHLLENIGPGHHLFADRYYTTHRLMQFLRKNKFTILAL